MGVNKSKHGVFAIVGKGTQSPWEYGNASVVSAFEQVKEDYERLIGTKETDIQRKIAAKPSIVALHLIALHISVFYVIAFHLVGLKKEVLTEIGNGISVRLNKIFNPDGSNSSANGAPMIYEAFQLYGTILHNDLKAIYSETWDGNCTNYGEAAEVFVSNLAQKCGFSNELESPTIEIVRLKIFASINGILLLKKLIEAEVVTFVD
jgi:hypothetical protein